MKLELVSHAFCPFVHRAAIMLKEKGVAFERRSIDLKNKPDWFLAISPRGKVPLLIADGVVIFESTAIIEFLDETQPPRIMPEDPFERARHRGWVEMANDLFLAQYKLHSAPSEPEYAAAKTGLAGTLAKFEDAIDGGIVREDRFGLLDVVAAPGFYRMLRLGDRYGKSALAALPNVEAWAKRLAVRPSVVETAPDNLDGYVRTLIERGSWIAQQPS